MIGYLEGKIKKLFPGETLVLTSSGVGYRIRIADIGILPEQEVKLYVHTAVRQDNISLWGFTSESALQLFELLLSVSGVGLKTAYTLLTVFDVQQIVSAISNSDAGALKVPGIGSKTAERIIIDLRSSINNLSTTDDTQVGASGKGQSIAGDSLEQEVKAALLALGYKTGDIEKELRRIPNAERISTQAVVRQLLQVL